MFDPHASSSVRMRAGQLSVGDVFLIDTDTTFWMVVERLEENLFDVEMVGTTLDVPFTKGFRFSLRMAQNLKLTAWTSGAILGKPLTRREIRAAKKALKRLSRV